MVTELFAELFYKYVYKGVIAAIRKSGWSSVGTAVLNRKKISRNFVEKHFPSEIAMVTASGG